MGFVISPLLEISFAFLLLHYAVLIVCRCRFILLKQKSFLFFLLLLYFPLGKLNLIPQRYHVSQMQTAEEQLDFLFQP